MQYVGSIGEIESVAVSTTSALALSSGDRKYGLIYNDSGVTVYIAFGDTATASAGGFSVAIDDGAFYEIPGLYKGPVSVITASGSGNISVTSVS